MARPVMTGTGMALCYQARGRSGKVVARGWRGQGVGAPLGGGGVEWWRPTCWWLGWARGRPPPHHRPATSGRWSQQTGGWCPASVAVAGEACTLVHTPHRPHTLPVVSTPPPPPPRTWAHARVLRPGALLPGLVVVWHSKVQCDSGYSSRGVVNTLGQTSPVSAVTCPPPPRPRPRPARSATIQSP